MSSASATCASRWTTARCCWPTGTSRARRASEPQPTVLVRSPYGRRQLVRPDLRTAAGRARPAGRRPERARHVRLAGRVQPVRRARRRPGHAALDPRTALARRADRHDRPQLPRAGAVGASRPTPETTSLRWRSRSAPRSSTARPTPAAASRWRRRPRGWCSSPPRSAGSLRWRCSARLRRLPALFAQLPIADLDARATGAEVAWFREALASPGREDAYWVARDFAAGVGKVAAPVQLVGGWQDIFLPWMLEDFAALQAAGRAPQLIIGPWTHTSPGMLAAGLREGLGWLRAHLLGDDRLLRPSRVRVFVTGERAGGGWRELGSWPPPGTGERRLWLAAGARLQDVGPAGDPGGGDRYRYDPADPTPSLGGPVLLAREPVSTTARSRRGPTCSPTPTAPLPETVEAIGPVRVELLRTGQLAALRPVRARLRRRRRRRVVERVRRARPASRPGASSRPRTTPRASPSTCGRWATASPPATGSACRSPPAPTRATRATRAPARTSPPRPRCARSTSTVLHDAQHPSRPGAARRAGSRSAVTSRCEVSPEPRARRNPAAEHALELHRDRDRDVIAPGRGRNLHAEREPAGAEAEGHLRDGHGREVEDGHRLKHIEATVWCARAAARRLPAAGAAERRRRSSPRSRARTPDPRRSPARRVSAGTGGSACSSSASAFSGTVWGPPRRSALLIVRGSAPPSSRTSANESPSPSVAR